MARRTPLHIDRRQAENVLAARSFARGIGRALGLTVSVNLSKTASGNAANLAEGFTRIRRRHFTRWWAREVKAGRARGEPTFIWSIENPPTDPNLHWTLYIPEKLETAFKVRMKSWVEREFGATWDETAIHYRPAGTSAAEYLLKAVDPKIGQRFKIKTSNQGEIEGKRCGFTENLGPAARERYLAAALVQAAAA